MSNLNLTVLDRKLNMAIQSYQSLDKQLYEVESYLAEVNGNIKTYEEILVTDGDSSVNITSPPPTITINDGTNTMVITIDDVLSISNSYNDTTNEEPPTIFINGVSFTKSGKIDCTTLGTNLSSMVLTVEATVDNSDGNTNN